MTNNNIYTQLLALLMHQIDFEFSNSLQTGDISKEEYNRIRELKKIELITKYQDYINQEVEQ